MKPAIAVVIATWQRTHLLHRCLQALVQQTFPRNQYELIVVTDGPDRETTQFMQQWLQTAGIDVAVTCLSLPVKKGPAAARNAGWRYSKAELIVFTDDDTVPANDCLQQYWQAYIPYQQTPIAFSGQVKVPLSGSPTDYEMNTYGLQSARFVTANCACSREALEQTGGLDEAFTMAWREDTALEFDLRKSNIPIIKIPAAVIVHPVRPAHWGISIKEQKKGLYNALLYKKHTALYNETNTGRPPRYYYLMLLLLLLAVLFSFNNSVVAGICLMGWLLLTVWFTWKRLKNTSRTPAHIAEMAFTSAVIPVVSVYWNMYGAIKFRTFFI